MSSIQIMLQLFILSPEINNFIVWLFSSVCLIFYSPLLFIYNRIMQLPQTKKRESSDPMRTYRKTKVSPINLLKLKKNSEYSKIKNQSPTKKQQLRLFSHSNNLELDKLMFCGGMKLNTRFNISLDKRKRVIGPLKTIRVANPQKIELGSSTIQNYFTNFAPTTAFFAKKQKMLQNLQQSKTHLSLPLIDSKEIIICKQSYSSKKDNFYAFSQNLKCYVSLYKCQNDNNTVIVHPNILPTYGIWTLQTNQEKYYVTDMFQGSSLRNLIVEFGSLHEITAKIYMRQLVYGLCKMHSLGFSHNRLNMDNILHDKMGSLFINCFRSSKLPLSESQKALYLYFFPPETLLSKNYYSSQKNDIWAIGCIALQILVPKSIKLNKYHPYNKNLANKELTESILLLQKVQRIIQQKNIVVEAHPGMELSTSISALALQFISKCLSVKIENRPSINQLMAHPFISESPYTQNQQ